MHDLRHLFSEDHFSANAENLAERGFSLTEDDRIAYFDILDEQRVVDGMRAEVNALSKQFPQATEEEREELRERVTTLRDEQAGVEAELSSKSEKFNDRMFWVPNFSAEHVPHGDDDTDNEVIFVHGEVDDNKGFVPRDHLDLGTELGIFDNESAAALSGSRFSIYRNKGARLKRALVNFMLDAAAGNGYEEVEVPYLVRPEIMRGTGQLPKFKDDMFTTTDNRGNTLYLIPTTEVPLTNMLKDRIFSHDELPYRLTGYSENFRREAGKAGKDTRGLIRNHQFPKIELVRIAHPETSWESYREMIDEACFVLDALRLPFRTVELCTGDLGFAALSTRDLEVWLPSQNRYLEVSSVSNTGDFQARRMGMKYLDPETKKREYVHTLNGTAVAVGRLLACIIENNQTADGSVEIPEALHEYTGFERITRSE